MVSSAIWSDRAGSWCLLRYRWWTSHHLRVNLAKKLLGGQFHVCMRSRDTSNQRLRTHLQVEPLSQGLVIPNPGRPFLDTGA
jgi:hypothetical protein